MAGNESPRAVGSPRRVVSRVLRTGYRLAIDALVLGLYVLALVLMFLATGWPGWAFYALLVGGTALYVVVTAGWIDGRRLGDG